MRLQGTQKGGRKIWLPTVKGGCARPFAPLKRGVLRERNRVAENDAVAPDSAEGRSQVNRIVPTSIPVATPT